LLEFKDGEIIVAVRTEDDGNGIHPVSVATKTVEVLDKSFAAVFDMCRRVGNDFVETCGPLFNERSGSAELEFGLGFTTKGTAFIIEASGQATLKVKLSFSKK